MVIAYVDDLIAVGQQEQLDGMRATLDALYTMKTSGAIPAENQPGIEPLKFLGCFIERLPSGEMIMHQKSYIEHCFKNNDMLQIKVARSLPNVDEKSPPEDLEWEMASNSNKLVYEAPLSNCKVVFAAILCVLHHHVHLVTFSGVVHHSNDPSKITVGLHTQIGGTTHPNVCNVWFPRPIVVPLHVVR